MPPPQAAITGFHDFARQQPGKLALVVEPGGHTASYGALDCLANQIAHALVALGVQEGDCIAACLPNDIPMVATILAAQRSGIYFTLLSPKASASDLHYIATDSGSRVLLVGDARTAAQLDELLQGACRVLVCHGSAEPPGAWELLVAAQPVQLPANARPGMEMIYSSGTTGRPKGVRRDFHCKYWGEVDSRNVEAMRWLSGSPRSVYLSTAPLYHSAPYRLLCGFLDAGATAIIMANFDATASLELIDRHAVTHSSWVPTMFQRLLRLDRAARTGFSGRSMTHVVHGAAPCPVHVKHAMIGWWGPVLYEYYSGTEGIGRTFINSAEWLAHPGSVGKPSGCVAHILDGQGLELPRGHVGNIYFESNVSFTYWNDPSKTRASESRQGWRTFGDIGYLDADGYLYLTDRKGFMVISGGVNIYPQEIENILLEHPRVADAAVFGVPDEDLGEKLAAVVQLVDGAPGDTPTADELFALCRSRGGGIKTPRLLRFCVDFPRGDTGKVQKRFLRDRIVQEPQPWPATGTLPTA